MAKGSKNRRNWRSSASNRDEQRRPQGGANEAASIRSSKVRRRRLLEAAAVFLAAVGAYANLLSIFIQLKDLDDALPLADEALRRFPDIAAIQWNAGSVYLLAGRSREAQAAYRRALELDPSINRRADIRSPMH